MNRSILMFLFVVSGTAMGKGQSNTVKEPQSAQFEIERGLLNKIYNESTASEKSFTSHPVLIGITVSPQILLSNANDVVLTNRYFDVSYSDSLKGVPGISFSVSSPVALWGNFQISLVGKASYSFKELSVGADSKSGGSFKDQVRLHWLPLTFGSRAEYEISGLSFVKPYVNAGLGIQWLYQTGRLDGIEQGFWVPFYQIGGGVVFFGQKNSQWFGGITTGINLNQSFGSSQVVKSSSFDVGVNFIL